VKISSQLSDESVLREIGGRLARLRLDRNLTQAQLALQAGVSKSTLERLESGAVAARLSAFIRIARQLGVVDRFDILLPEPIPSPVEQLKWHGKQRQRASTVQPVKASRSHAKPWQWGDKP